MAQYRRDEKTGLMAKVVSSTHEYKIGFAAGVNSMSKDKTALTESLFDVSLSESFLTDGKPIPPEIFHQSVKREALQEIINSHRLNAVAFNTYETKFASTRLATITGMDAADAEAFLHVVKALHALKTHVIANPEYAVKAHALRPIQVLGCEAHNEAISEQLVVILNDLLERKS